MDGPRPTTHAIAAVICRVARDMASIAPPKIVLWPITSGFAPTMLKSTTKHGTSFLVCLRQILRIISIQQRSGIDPTQRFDSMANAEAIRQKAWQTYHFTEEAPPKSRFSDSSPVRQTAEFEALGIMGLESPVTLAEIKARYKTLVKKYHPDHNREDPNS
jgi:hypothetical protein